MLYAAATTDVAAPPVTMGLGLRFLKRQYSTRAAGLASVGILGASFGYMALERHRYRSRHGSARRIQEECLAVTKVARVA
jgi:hypothetical protein